MNWVTFLEYYFPHLPQPTYDLIAKRIEKNTNLKSWVSRTVIVPAASK